MCQIFASGAIQTENRTYFLAGLLIKILIRDVALLVQHATDVYLTSHTEIVPHPTV
jgi:hypothetical protein